MKNSISPSSRVSQKISTTFGCIGLLLILASCGKDASKPTPALSNEEAAALMASSMADDTGGVFAQASGSSKVTSRSLLKSGEGRTLDCEFSLDSAFTLSKSSAAITATYNFSYTYGLSCTPLNVPESFVAEFSYNGSYETTLLMASVSGEANLAIGELLPSKPEYLITGVYTREGTTTSKSDEEKQISSELTLTLDELSIDKSTQTINEGAGSITLSGTVEGKGDFSYDATFLYNTDNTITITIDDEEYVVNLETGDING